MNSKKFDEDGLFPMTIVHQDRKLTFDKNDEGKVFMLIDNKPMIDYQFLGL